MPAKPVGRKSTIIPGMCAINISYNSTAKMPMMSRISTAVSTIMLNRITFAAAKLALISFSVNSFTNLLFVVPDYWIIVLFYQNVRQVNRKAVGQSFAVRL